ncbi:hypothetical protein GmHk_04G009530 [Glycine max]|nr:hypothetical protein GmHk_04G009530 [Glycine max]
MYDNIISEEIDMNEENEEEPGVNEENGEEPGMHQHVDYSDVFGTCDDVLNLAQSVAYDIGFVAVVMRSDTNTIIRGRTSFGLIGCERSENIGKCGCLFKLRVKLVVRGEGWMMKLICESHNHALAKLLVGHPYANRTTKDEKIIIAYMTKSMVK